MTDKKLTATMLAIVLGLVAILFGFAFAIEAKEQKQFNNGVCQTCGGDIIPVGHQYTTSYYCPKCKTYNK
jgi:Zn finger protein HypA/HybF involved in hydrogenase expression